MKKIILSVFTVVLFASCSTSQSTSEVETSNESFKVYGNCGMCEKTIEGSLAHVDGVVKADWDKDTKQIEIAFDSTKINLDEIKQKIAGVGYDMDGISASTSVYSALPGCCQYDRPVAK